MNLLFVRMETDEGIVGYGEVCDSYGCGNPLSIQAIIDEALSPLLLGEDPSATERLIFKMRGWTRRRLGDQGMVIQAISGVEIALWDLLGKIQGTSVSQLLGRLRDAVPVYASGSFLEEGPPDWHLKLFEPCFNQGVRAIKVRIGLDFKRDLKTLRSIRSMIGDDIQIIVDGNEHFTVATALEVAKALHELNVFFFEEPVPQHNREGIARLVDNAPLPIAYGEHLYTRNDFQDGLIHKRMEVVQPDAATCGGISEAKRIASIAEIYGAPVVPHSAAGPIALAANLHFGASAGNVLMLEYAFTIDRVWKEMLQDPLLSPSRLQDGRLPVPEGPGLGLLIDEEIWNQYPYRPMSVVSLMPTWSQGYV